MNDKQTEGRKTVILLKRSAQCLLFCVLLPVIMSCAPAPYQKQQIDMVWPLPPEEPKIKYVDTIRSTLDVGAERGGLGAALYGEERVVALSKPYGVAVDTQGVIYVTDAGRVFVFDLKNKTFDFIGIEPGSGKLAFPVGISSSADGRIFITDISQDRVFVYQNKKFVGAIGQTGELESPSGVAVDEKKGVIYVVDSKKHLINVYGLNDYRKIRTIGKRGTLPGEFNFPTNIALDAKGWLYVVNTGNFRVDIFDDQGNFVKLFGRLGDSFGALPRPKGIAVDSAGNVYVVDTAFANVQIFSEEGQLLLPFGSHGDGPGKFWLPAGLAIDHEDKIYVVDQYPGLVQIFQYLGGKGRQAGVPADKK